MSESSMKFISVISKAVATSVVDQLTQATNMILQDAKNKDFVKRRTSDQITADLCDLHLDKALATILERDTIYALGVRKAIVVDVSTFIDPESTESTTVFVPRNTALVPVRLIQQSNTPLSRVASKDFTDELTKEVTDTLDHYMEVEGHDMVREMFVREKRVLRARHGLPSTDPCCIFRMLEEDYTAPATVGKTEISSFAIDCNICSVKHEIKVIR